MRQLCERARGCTCTASDTVVGQWLVSRTTCEPGRLLLSSASAEHESTNPQRLRSASILRQATPPRLLPLLLLTGQDNCRHTSSWKHHSNPDGRGQTVSNSLGSAGVTRAFFGREAELRPSLNRLQRSLWASVTSRGGTYRLRLPLGRV